MECNNCFRQNRFSEISYGSVCSLTYNYDFAQQISSMNETIAGTEQRFVYEYDQRDQLTKGGMGSGVQCTLKADQRRLKGRMGSGAKI